MPPQQQSVSPTSTPVQPTEQEKKLLQGLHHLAAIVESSDDAIISKNLNGIIMSWNHAAEQILGYSAEEIVGQSILKVIPEEMHGDETLILSRIRAGIRIEHFQTQRLRKDGTRIEVSLTISPVKDENGKIVGAAKILRDITRQKQLEAALQASERLASAGRLAATIAHEINNPLAGVMNAVFLARQQPDLTPDSERYLALADEELRRVAHIAQQTLGFYRSNAGVSQVDIAAAAEGLLNIYTSKMKEKHVRVEQRIPRGLAVRTQPGELKQVLSNVLSNAIDACATGGRIRIRAHPYRQAAGGQGVRISISDNGSGIPADHLAKLFTPFFTTKKVAGTGLGLWITKDLLAKNGGTIRMRSRATPPTGTVVSFRLPDMAEDTDRHSAA